MEMLHIEGVSKLTIHNLGCDRTQLDKQQSRDNPWSEHTL